MIKGILLDLDGTLLDNNKIIYEVYMNIFKEKGIPLINFNEFREAYTTDFWKFLKRFNLYDKSINVIWLNNYDKFRDKISPFPGALEFLNKIREDGFKIGLVTGGSKSRVIKDLRKRDLHRHFDIIITGDDTDKIKPDPTCLKIAIEKLGLSANEVVYIGDMDGDILAAKKLGIKALGVSWGIHGTEILQKFEPYKIVNSFDELYQTIKKM